MSHRISRLFLAGLLPLAALAACGDDAAPVEDSDGATASGEILEGTISDAMLPVDRLRSEPPLVREDTGEDAPGEDDNAPAEGGGTQNTAQDAAEG
ncbi:hypothetical protein [Aurantiacibacter spongiae]|uniref:Argininosuccinate lyase n=1 Tax=Aurantiacibacter spongiae TaxID=2488860 RepID=A0A3N5DM54_9SPHN|nr:hypothetical protein [Aurantiacibacter spongiae]RPF71915.1 hypothetical protein EG799_10015 [Aurantiacibacter spongiae]